MKSRNLIRFFYFAVNRHCYSARFQWVPWPPCLSPLSPKRCPKSPCAGIFLLPHPKIANLAVSARRASRQPPPAAAPPMTRSRWFFQITKNILKFKILLCSAEAPGLATAQNLVQGTESKVQGVSRGGGRFKDSKAASVRIKCGFGRFQ